MWLEIILQVETIHVLIFHKVFSDIGQVWGWGYGGEGQLGLGSRIRMVSSPHLIPCLESSSYGKDKSSALARGIVGSEGEDLKVPGSFVKEIACGGRHSAVITDAGALLTFGWGLYGQVSRSLSPMLCRHFFDLYITIVLVLNLAKL